MTRQTATPLQQIRDLTEATARLVDEIIPDGEGACLGASAILAYVLRSHGVATTAVFGSYDEHARWWLQTDALRIDATRAQFDGGPLVERLDDIAARDENPYLIERTLEARWDRDQAVIEFGRMFTYPDVGETHARRILAALEDATTGCGRPVLVTQGA